MQGPHPAYYPTDLKEVPVVSMPMSHGQRPLTGFAPQVLSTLACTAA